MIVVMRQGATRQEIENVEKRLIELGFKTHPIYGEVKTVIGAVGDKRLLEEHNLLQLPGVERILSIMKPYKLVGREFKNDNTVVKVGDVEIGAKKLVVMAGPCAVESQEQMYEVAKRVKDAGATVLRGGAYKPRTSPYSFQGMEEEGLKMLSEAARSYGLKVVTEVMDTRDVELVSRYADILQIGTRNMQNFRLLKECGLSRKPVLLKRGLCATIEEWLMAAEYIAVSGNPNIILCERGIRTFETTTRNTMDINAVPVVRELSHLPIVVDPSHGTGNWKWVDAVSRAFVAAGVDGLMVEVHPDPANAVSDGIQSLEPDKFDRMMKQLKPIAQAVGREL
ncbi:MAG: 3-deoxy-7-phosphoheptulonate synthase [Clostridiales bacterium]|nr:3-deoxy-7-phosphoheptulonate synthase [Clostridiales bacterium]